MYLKHTELSELYMSILREEKYAFAGEKQIHTLIFKDNTPRHLSKQIFLMPSFAF